ncbi:MULTISPECIES: hypothetical protein [unclassified Streptomyces]|uniref:hypothetical protein n=1 Tax=unclassified Streptomyces TaxID=2593676 RepID=UPI0003707E13|nr:MULTISPECIES: hypothetical protein [unclassified Streptomyces]
MTDLDHETVAAVRAARLIVVNAKWRLREEQALGRLAGVPGLARTPLFPGHPVIQVVARDGRLLGRVRRRHEGGTVRWSAVPAGAGREIGAYRGPRRAARALARHHGFHPVRVTDCPAPAEPPSRPPWCG